MWLICLLISHVDVAHGYFAYVNEISFAYLEHLVHEGVAKLSTNLFCNINAMEQIELFK